MGFATDDGNAGGSTGRSLVFGLHVRSSAQTEE
jgi:hypothetical protein